MSILRGKAKAFIIVGVVVTLLIVLVATWLGRDNPQAVAQVEGLVKKYGYAGVFTSTVIAGSIIPFGSPIIVGCAVGLGLDVVAVAFTAATGYTLGVLTSYVPAWLLGEHYVVKRMGREAFEEYATSWNRRGYLLCVLFSLVPGFPVDLLALMCGCFHTRARWFIPVCWLTLLVQFVLCGWLGGLVGSLVGV